MTKGNVTFSLNALYYQISFFFKQRPFFSYDFSSPLQDALCSAIFYDRRTHMQASLRIVARLLEIQAETAMNHVLIDSTGAPRPPCRSFLQPRACGNRVSGETFASGITKNRVWPFTGKSLALKMKNRHCRNLFNGQPRLALTSLRTRALLIIRSARNRKCRVREIVSEGRDYPDDGSMSGIFNPVKPIEILRQNVIRAVY